MGQFFSLRNKSPPFAIQPLAAPTSRKPADRRASTLDLCGIAVIERSKCLLTPKDNPSGPDSPAHRQSRALEQGRR
ncbi:MAG: hypothetical protein AB3N24_23045, partial [Leisingera sp.]